MKSRFGLVGYANHPAIYYSLRKEYLEDKTCEFCKGDTKLFLVPKLQNLKRHNLRSQPAIEWSVKVWYLKNVPKAFIVACVKCKGKIDKNAL